MPPWGSNNKIRDVIKLSYTDLKTKNLLLVLKLGFD